VLVTGASGGIGRATAAALAAGGFDLVLHYKSGKAAAEETLRIVQAAGRQGRLISFDLADRAGAETALSEDIAAFGAYYGVVCNAGITRDGVVWKLTGDAWDEVLRVNLKGAFAYCHAAAPVFRAQRSGRVVTIASINGLRGKFGQANYAASKAGLVALTKTLARELGSAGATVNCVAPGMVETELVATLPPEIRQKAEHESALGRIANPDDVASVVTFLCSARARHITGAVIKVDGGQYM
jgi:3-oxoacyl-[acyl-carrier protein] reductase